MSQPIGTVAAMSADPDRIPAVDDDPDAAARALREARRGIVVVMSPNVVMPLADAEVYAQAAPGGGLATYVVGWRRARGPEEMAPHYQAVWRGPVEDPLEGHGEPFCWRQRTPVGVGPLSALLDDQWANYNQAMRRAAGCS